MLIKIGYKSRHKQAKPRYIDLFAGCGGLSLGLHQAGWQGIFAVEKSPDAFATLKHNLIDKKNHFDWPSWLGEPKNLEINTLLRNHKPELLAMQGQVDLVAGGPPCQGFSTAGRRNPNDGRNMLIKSYVDFIQLVMPKLIFFENVKGFTIEFKQNREKGKLYSKYVVNALRDLGYAVKGQLIDFGSYGLPQKRTRFILVGIRNGIGSNSQATAESFFANLQNERFAFLSGKGISVGTTLQDAISDLSMRHGTVPSHETPRFREGIYSKPSSAYQVFLRQDSDSRHVDSHRFANHKPEILKKFGYIIKYAAKGKNLELSIRRRFKIKKQQVVLLDGNAKTRTITTLPDDHIHYDEPRILTVREYARIQSFPDWYEFKGKYTTGGKRRTQEVPRYSQIGNAVPPLFSEQSGKTLMKMLNHE